jgi:Transposase
MPRRYPAEVRHQVIELARSGTKVAQLAETFGMSDATVYNWLVHPVLATGLQLVAPGKAVAGQAAAGAVLPLRLAGQAGAAPGAEGPRVVPGEVDGRVAGAILPGAVGTLRVGPVRPLDLAPPGRRGDGAGRREAGRSRVCSGSTKHANSIPLPLPRPGVGIEAVTPPLFSGGPIA